MESPVRIYIGAALVVNLLLLTSKVTANTLPIETTRNPFSKTNVTTWRSKPKLPDVALNELHPKDSTSEEHTEKNAKYKDRGRVKFNLSKPTQSTAKRTASVSDVIIVTPTPEIKKPAEIISSMHTYKKTKMPTVTVASTNKPFELSSIQNDEYDDDDADEEDEMSTKFDGGSFFTMPSFDDDDDFNSKKYMHGFDMDMKNDHSKPSYDSFSSLFPKSVYTQEESSYTSDSYFDFNSDLTTPKNNFFDKKYQEVSSSILNHLDIIKSKSPPPNITNINKIVKENVGFDKVNNNTPANKSSVFIKNTKEIRYLDSDNAGSSSDGLSDVQGTSIYYEMTVLSTETYNFKDSNDYDCENDTETSSTTPSTPMKEEIDSIQGKLSKKVEISSKKLLIDSEPSPVSISTVASQFFPSTAQSALSSVNPMPTSTQNAIFSTDTSRIYSSNYNSRNKNYSKRLNLSGTKNSPNSVFSTLQTAQASPNQTSRPQTRRFHFTTPKIKPIWMAPRKNYTRPLLRVPTTIYYEHFDIKDKIMNKTKTKGSLTTQSSEIDPVLQSEVSGVKKIVHSQSISDNTIPSLWKRGSTKFATSTSASGERNTGADLEIPPTMTAWALASLRSPPPPNYTVNSTVSTQKSFDENELQKIVEVLDKKEGTTSTTVTANNFVTKNITEIYQKKLQWKPVLPTLSNSVLDIKERLEPISERVPAESNISIQSSAEPASTLSMASNDTNSEFETESPWIPLTDNDQTVESNNSLQNETETIPPVDGTKSTGFESITKLPSSVTTPSDDTASSSEVKNITQELKQHVNVQPSTDNYEITTIRFSYVPIETEETISTDVTDWIPVSPTRTRETTTDDTPVTTYRPKYVTTSEKMEETTIFIDNNTSPIEVSSQTIENTTHREVPITTEMVDNIIYTDIPTTTDMSIPETTTEDVILSTTELTTTPIETTTIIVTVATEINSERVPITTVPDLPETTVVEEIKDKENEIITQDKKPTETEIYTTSMQTKHIPTTIKYMPAVKPSTTVPTTTGLPDLVESTTESVEITTKTVNDLEDLTSYSDVTTEASLRTLEEETGSGAAIAIAVSTIGVIALVLLVGLLLVVRRRGRRGVYAQRCTPVSLDAYSLDSVSVGHRKGNQRLRASKRSYGNPAYDDEVTSHPMQYPALANFAMDIDSITAEFSEIPSVTVRPDEVPPGCEDKNRYSNVLPLPETRVPLSRIGNDPTSEYINANYVTGPGNIRDYYIACQAPLSNTVTDFWRMIWEQNSRLIVMLTEYMENGIEKCYEYLPPSEISDSKRTFGEFQIILKKREQKDKYGVSSVQLINLNTRTWREVTHMWYFWPAKGVPDDYDSVIDFLSEMRSYMKVSQTAKEYDEDGVEVIYQDQSRSSYHNLSKLRSDENGSSNGMNVYSPAKAEEMMRKSNPTNGTLGKMKAASEVEGIRPCTVVCASGAGRSAALIAADICLRALAAGRADIPRVVRKLRDQRPHSLTNRHHYIFLYRLLSEYGNKLMGGGMDTI